MAKQPEKPKPFRVTKVFLWPGLFAAFLVRWCVANYPYSGYSKPPMYGDFEAQRHWQEITLQLPINQWYHNSTHNDLNYWGLDYPPLSAYHSYIMGWISYWFEPDSVCLFASRGYTSDSHKLFMRWTVFLSDLYIYVTAVIIFCVFIERIKPKTENNVFKRMDILVILLLLYPGLILIDHGHFQYNCVSLGLFIWSTVFIVAIDNKDIASILFVLALNYKQMELYHSLPFFFYVLRKCFFDIQGKKKIQYILFNINKTILSVITPFIFIWWPFLRSIENITQVVYRLFPIKRGVFEDKVSNVWCAINVLVKLKTVYTNEEMAKKCLIMTVLAVLPSCLDLFLRCNKNKFILSQINVSLAFFLFSFQVHEKTILLVAIPVALHFPSDPFMCFWFLLVSTFSMLPLLIKDGLTVPYFATIFLYMVVFSLALKLAKPLAKIYSIFDAYTVYSCIQPVKPSIKFKILSVGFIMSFISMLLLSIEAVVVRYPMPRYPDLIPLLISVNSCVHFLFFFVYFNKQQFAVPSAMPFAYFSNPKKVKTN